MPTIAIDKDTFDVWGKHTHVTVDFTFDASYPAGGEALAARDFMMTTIKEVMVVGGNAAAGRLLFHYDTTNKKLMCLYPTGGVTASPAALADPFAVASAVGADTITIDPIAITPGRGKEVVDTTDLSTITVRLQVIGLGT